MNKDSKEIKALKRMFRDAKYHYRNVAVSSKEYENKLIKDTEKDYRIIREAIIENEYLKTELLGLSQELNVKNKALEIINNKGLVNLYIYEPMLTKEEYELLKEVLL